MMAVALFGRIHDFNSADVFDTFMLKKSFLRTSSIAFAKGGYVHCSRRQRVAHLVFQPQRNRQRTKTHTATTIIQMELIHTDITGSPHGIGIADTDIALFI
ncbi:hypothetical protein SS45_18675 [Enterobacter hormaechei subsp. steigerwaltii]|nr:hypothetical protein SS45_18675 [Enterobacter hormaechei subsp. steigerwaltii]